MLADTNSLVIFGRNNEYPISEEFGPAFAAFFAVHSAATMAHVKEKGKDDSLQIVRTREDDFKSSIVELPTASTIIELAEQIESDSLASLSLNEILNTCNLYWHRAAPWCTGRRLFTTTQKWLGFGPESLEQGDEVWLLKNAKVPFLLRPHGESQHTLVGEV